MRVSKYIKAHKDVLLEYIYDDNNNIGEGYKILTNVKDRTSSYVSATGSSTYNSQVNQLFRLDAVTNNWGLLDTTNYTFLQLKDYATGFPLKHDTIKIHLPVNYTFGEYLGCHVRIYAFDFDNKVSYDLSSFFFDNTDVNRSYLLNYNSPPFQFNEKLWGKNLTLQIPSLDALSNQRTSSGAKTNSINANLTGGIGMSQNSPIFIDFSFITTKRTVNSVTTYFLTAKTTFSLPQTPEFENLGVVIEHSKNGDFFEIYGVYNGNLSEFKTFMDNSVSFGSKYYVEYQVTLYEQNIRGKSFKIVLTDNFNEKVEYRPIIKYSTTTAIIDVEMRVIDAVDESTIYRRASYGMLQDEVAKYSLNLSKINIANASKPKIYNIKSPEGAGIFGRDRNGVGVLNGLNNTEIILEPVKVNYAVLSDRFNVVAKSDTTDVGTTRFFGEGKLMINLKPFDNVVKFIIAREIGEVNVLSNTTTTLASSVGRKPQYMDMTNMGEIKFVIKNNNQLFETGLYVQSNEVDLSLGVVVFKISGSRINDIKKISDSGTNLFYITSTTDTGTVVVYSGLFKLFDSTQNINELNNSLGGGTEPLQVTVLSNAPQQTVIVKPKLPTQLPTAQPQEPKQNSTSTYNKVSVAGVIYEINPDSSLTISGYRWSNNQLKEVLGLTEAPTNLKFRDAGLYSNDKFLQKLEILKADLERKYLTTPEQNQIFNTTVNNTISQPTPSQVTSAANTLLNTLGGGTTTVVTPTNTGGVVTSSTPGTIDLNNLASLSDVEFRDSLDQIATAYNEGRVDLKNQPLSKIRTTAIVTRAARLAAQSEGGGL